MNPIPLQTLMLSRIRPNGTQMGDLTRHLSFGAPYHARSTNHIGIYGLIECFQPTMWGPRGLPLEPLILVMLVWDYTYIQTKMK